MSQNNSKKKNQLHSQKNYFNSLESYATAFSMLITADSN